MGPIVTIYFSQCCCGIIKGNHLPSNADAGCSSGRWWMMWTSPTTDVRQLSDKICNKPIMRTLNGHDHLFPSDQWAEVQAVPHLFYLPSPFIAHNFLRLSPSPSRSRSHSPFGEESFRTTCLACWKGHAALILDGIAASFQVFKFLATLHISR